MAIANAEASIGRALVTHTFAVDGDGMDPIGGHGIVVDREVARRSALLRYIVFNLRVNWKNLLGKIRKHQDPFFVGWTTTIYLQTRSSC